MALERELKLKLDRIKAVREAGEVRRCHALPHQSNYTIASHSYGAVNLLLLLHPNPSVNLIKALIWHDVAERWLGDLPSPGKGICPEMQEAYERIEDDILRRLELRPELTEIECAWAAAMDLADLFLWATVEHHQYSNWAATAMMDACKRSLDKMLFNLKPICKEGEDLADGLHLLLIYQQRGYFCDRLSDFMWTPKN
jgi:5'-deoxynucleotidase YfbR-like HD superfamily hydrolase